MTDLATRPRRRTGAFAHVALAGALAVAAGCGPGPMGPSISPDPGASAPAATDLPLATVPPTPEGAGTPSPSATSSPRSATAAQSEGVRATRIRIDRLGIDLAIIEGDGIDAPIGKAAHHPGSAWPGSRSNTYIYGHARKGMFIALWQAREGDEVVLDLVDGTSSTYVVTRVLPRVPWDAVQYLEPTASEQLTLQTSTAYEPTAPRFIVVAVPKK